MNVLKVANLPLKFHLNFSAGIFGKIWTENPGSCLWSGSRSFVTVLNSNKYGAAHWKIVPQLSQSQGCTFLPCRNAWFTKSKYGPRIPPTKPLDFDHSGDLEQSLPTLDLSKPRYGYENSEELRSADDEVQKIFSLEFGTAQDRKKFHMEEFLSRTQRSPADYCSIEAKITRLTVKIRTQIGYCLAFRKDKVNKRRLNNNIQTRRKLLKRLRLADIKKFKKVCHELSIVFIPVPEVAPPKTIRERTLLDTNNSAAIIRQGKIKALESEMAVKRQEFYKEKQEALVKIEEDLEAMNIDGQTMMLEIEDKERRLERWKNTKLYRFLQRFPAVNKKYLTLKVQQ